MDSYEQRKERRIERYRRRAERLTAQGLARLCQADAVANRIPMGQPVLVGHHSERRHRRDLEKIRASTVKGFGALAEAKEWERRAEAAESSTAVSSDDPTAVEKLRQKLAALESRRDDVKAAYKARGERGDYVLTNLGANILRVKERIAGLERRADRESSEQDIGGIRLVENVEGNRLQLFFPSKPTDEVRRRLKRDGFRWSRTEGAWQRHLNEAARSAAKSLVQSLAAQAASPADAPVAAPATSSREGMCCSCGERVSHCRCEF
jgi:hypothetical protein